MNLRVFVTTVEGCPSFLVHERVRDQFIAEEVERRYGRQADEEPHAWEAHDETAEAKKPEAQERETVEAIGGGE